MSRLMYSVVSGVWVCLAGICAFGPGTTIASTPQTQYTTTRIPAPDPQVGGRWGERVASAGDINRDGVPDFFVGEPSYTSGSLTTAGRVYLIEGKTGKPLYHIDSPEPQAKAKFGFFISIPGDLNRDGKNDIVIGTDQQTVAGRVGQGKAWAFSGANGKLLYELNDPNPQGTATDTARFGSRIGSAGDLTGDGVPDLIVGASNQDVPSGCGAVSPTPVGCHKHQGQAFIFDGATGRLIRTLNLPSEDQVQPTCTSSCGSFGLAVQSPGDVNGDGVPDQLVDGGSANGGVGRMYVFSGKTGQLMRKIDDPTPQPGAVFGFQDVAPLTPGDVNHDGGADIFGNGFAQDGSSGKEQGRAWIFEGRTGRVLHELKDPHPQQGGQFAFSAAMTDYNKDGTPDIYVGKAPHDIPPFENGGTYIYDGKTGKLLKSLELPPADAQPGSDTNGGPSLGFTDAAPGDLNHDGQPDYIAGAPFEDVGANKDQGVVYLFLSSDKTRPSKPRIAGPRHSSSRKRLTFRFTARDADNPLRELRFRCAFDRHRLHPCKSRISKRLAAGRHTLQVQAQDIAGNRSPIKKIKVVVTTR